MIGFLRRLFGPSIYDLATSDDPAPFVEALGSMKITMLGSLHQEDGLPLESVTEEELLAEIEQAANALAAREEFTPFSYETDGVKLLPFFTSRSSVDSFCGAYCYRENRLFQFPAFVLNVSVLACWTEQFDAVVMDPQTDNELQLTDDHLQVLQTRWRSPEKESRYILRELPRKARYLVTPVPHE